MLAVFALGASSARAVEAINVRTDAQAIDLTDSAERYRTEVVLAQFRGQLCLLDRAEKAPPADESAYGTQRTVTGVTGAVPASGPPPMDDEIPF